MDKLAAILIVVFLANGCSTLRYVDHMRQHDDSAVIELVLIDLTTYNEPNRPLSLVPLVPRVICFSTKPVGGPHPPGDALEYDSVLGSLSNSENANIHDAIRDATLRYERSPGVAGFDLTHRLIRVVDGALPRSDATDETPYSALYPIQAFPPGYSKDRKCVVVQLYIPEIFHPSFVTYVLITKHGEWTILHRGIITYI